jgi:hypothetical protein
VTRWFRFNLAVADSLEGLPRRDYSREVGLPDIKFHRPSVFACPVCALIRRLEISLL